MSEAMDRLIFATRQLLETELLLGGRFLPAKRNPLPSPSAEQAFAEPAAQALSPEEKARLLEEMDVGQVRGCTRCRLAGGRSQTVFGEGSPQAEVVFVGEGPGEEEDRTGRPFVGRAGELLTRMVQAMGLVRRDVYICNVIKCRPPNNRAPMSDEVRACWPYLMRQLQIIAPKVIVALGNPATQNLLATAVGITKLRGQWQKLPPWAEGLEGIAVMPTFHPAYILRQYNQETRAKVWSDLQQVMAFLGLRGGMKAPERPRGGDA
jgi:DNA polymerase